MAKLSGVEHEFELRAFAEDNGVQRSSDVLTNCLLRGDG